MVKTIGVHQCRPMELLGIILAASSVTNAFVVPPSRVAIPRPSAFGGDVGIPLRPPFSASSSGKTVPLSLLGFGGLELADTFYDSTSTAFDAWEWTNGISAPAALVAGAVLVTLSETREQLSPRKRDNKSTRFKKRMMRFLLLSSFALEVVSIFVATMTGSVLLGQSEQSVAKKMIGYGSPLQLMHHHHEFEYLTTQICFLQGLINWLGSVAVELSLSKPNETKSARRMNKCLSAWLLSLIVWILAFYNHHLSFYSDYAHMLWRFFQLFLARFVFEYPLRPLSLVYVPAFINSIRLTWKAFRSPPDEDED